MAGMETQLHLMAGQTGEFNGSAAEISGAGFSGMKFIAKATSQADFNRWLQTVRQSSGALSLSAYDDLAKPSMDNPQASYSSVENNLYNSIMMKYMAPASSGASQGGPATSSPMGMPGMGGMQ